MPNFLSCLTYLGDWKSVWAYLSKNNQAQQFVKFMISSNLHTHMCDLSRPALQGATIAPKWLEKMSPT